MTIILINNGFHNSGTVVSVPTVPIYIIGKPMTRKDLQDIEEKLSAFSVNTRRDHKIRYQLFYILNLASAETLPEFQSFIHISLAS